MVAGFTKNKDVRRAQRIKSLNARLNGASRFNEGGYCMKTDSQLKGDISEELAWDPAINAAGIGVMVAVGVVTLTGHLDSFAEACGGTRDTPRERNARCCTRTRCEVSPRAQTQRI